MSHRLLPRKPERYHGKENSRPYFEGWYFKQASDKGTVSVIVGVFRTQKKSDETAFIQLLLASGKSYYFEYPFEAFSAKTDTFEVKVGANKFSMERIVLDIDQDGVRVEAQSTFSDIVPLETNVVSPSIMGPFSYLPKMQCNHGVLSLTHRANGTMKIDSEQYLFVDAHGYIEKDWGEAFPSRWVWMQCNDEKVSLMCSIATIPYGAINFTGLICVLLVDGRQYRFATYNGARVVDIRRQGGELTVKLRRGKYKLQIKASSTVFGKLIAPTTTGMNRKIEETVDAAYHIVLTSGGKEVYSGTFGNGGLEMLDPELLIGTKK
jgi:tocopherol cyclase